MSKRRTVLIKVIIFIILMIFLASFFDVVSHAHADPCRTKVFDTQTPLLFGVADEEIPDYVSSCRWPIVTEADRSV
jgi:hypothetical protein